MSGFVSQRYVFPTRTHEIDLYVSMFLDVSSLLRILSCLHVPYEKFNIRPENSRINGRHVVLLYGFESDHSIKFLIH